MTRIPKRLPKTRVRELIADTEPRLTGLPMVHTTDAYRFADVLKSKTLQPTACPVFGEDLLYLFLGRPAYRTRKGANEHLTFDLPVTVILRPDAKLPAPKRVFPFDTGAFDRGIYRGYFHEDTILDDFELENSDASAIKYVSHFYTNIREYYNGSTRKNVEIPFDSFEAGGLLELARAIPDPAVTTSKSPDERSSSVEIQVTNAIDLVGKTLAVILPQEYLDTPGMPQTVDSLSPKYVKTYDVMKIMGSREIAAIVYHITRDIYISEGIFD